MRERGGGGGGGGGQRGAASLLATFVLNLSGRKEEDLQVTTVV